MGFELAMSRLPYSGGSATELSVTGAWRNAAVGDLGTVRLSRTNSESFKCGHLLDSNPTIEGQTRRHPGSPRERSVKPKRKRIVENGQLISDTDQSAREKPLAYQQIEDAEYGHIDRPEKQKPQTPLQNAGLYDASMRAAAKKKSPGGSSGGANDAEALLPLDDGQVT
jgi:hypothetical protein